MAEAKQLAVKVDKLSQANQSDRGGCRETSGLQRGAGYRHPQDQKPATGYHASAQAFASYLIMVLIGVLLGLGGVVGVCQQHGDPQPRALAEKVDQERKATASQEAPGAPVPPARDNRGDNTPVQATRTYRGTPYTGTATLPAVEEKPDEDMDDANAEQPRPGDSPGVELGADSLAVEEARKRIHATLDAGEDPLSSQPDSEGHNVLERLHLRPAAKARFTGPS
eukprot:380078-Amphidinium_carterae.1